MSGYHPLSSVYFSANVRGKRANCGSTAAYISRTVGPVQASGLTANVGNFPIGTR